MDEFHISCNWISENEKEINSVIVCTPEKRGIEGVTAETCVCLILKNAENVGPTEKPELEINSKHPLKELKVYSEASLIEVFGVYNEYLCTCKAEFLDDWEGLAVYHANIELPSVTKCTLKFTRIREKDRLWLYSIQPAIVQSNPANQRLFNFQNVINLMESGPQISDKAQEIKKMMEVQLKTSSASPFGFQSLVNIINKEYNSQSQDFKRNVSTNLNNSQLLWPSENSSKNDMSEFKLENEWIVNYIDKKFIEMKAELMNQMEINLAQLKKENNAKLDEIMKLIESIN